MHILNAKPFEAFMGTAPLSSNFGKVPHMAWIPLEALVVDEEYQREILRDGARNVGEIARNFNWNKFGSVVVASLGNGTFAIVDGQHRGLAALLRHIPEIPCLIIDADKEEQAKVFKAINAGVTKISPLSIFHAQIAAKEPEALDIMNMLKELKISLMKSAYGKTNLRYGETISIECIKECRKEMGPKTLRLALRCLMAPLRPGLLRASYIKPMCNVLEMERTFRAPEYRLVSLMEQYPFEEELDKARIRSVQTKRLILTEMTSLMFTYLDNALGD